MARRVFGESHELTLRMKCVTRKTLCRKPGDAETLDDRREAVTTLEETERTARRVLGGVHPFVRKGIEETRAQARRSAPTKTADTWAGKQPLYVG